MNNLIAYDGQIELEEADWEDDWTRDQRLSSDDDDDADCCPFCGDHYAGCRCNEGA